MSVLLGGFVQLFYERFLALYLDSLNNQTVLRANQLSASIVGAYRLGP